MAEPALEWHEFNNQYKNRSDVHWARKIWHIVTVFSIFLTYQFAPYSVSMGILFVACAILIPFDFLRLKYKKLNDVALIFMGPLMRNSEVKNAAGTTYLLAGVAVIAIFFPKPIVGLSLLFLAFADPLASYVGIRYGKDKILGNKSIQGFLMAFSVCAVITFLFLSGFDLLVSRRVVIAALCGMVGAFAELLPIAKLDDNLTMPILSALGTWAVFQLFGLSLSNALME
jgi:diacylglycerol kinase (CTP)